MKKYNVSFRDGDIDIKITYWFANNTLCIDGEAYFVQDDLLTDMIGGYFEHPWSNREYHLFPHSSFCDECILDVMDWKQLGRTKPNDCVDRS